MRRMKRLQRLEGDGGVSVIEKLRAITLVQEETEEGRGFGVQREDIWKLGEHRLFVGEPEYKENRDRILEEDEIALIISDTTKIERDVEGGVEYSVFSGVSKRGRTAVLFHETGDARIEIVDAMYKNGWTCSQEVVVIWNYGMFDYEADYQKRFLPGIIFTREGHRKSANKAITDVWRVDDRNGMSHFIVPMLHHADQGEIVFDPFCWGGQVIFACELTGRIARCICNDVDEAEEILRQWQKKTGKKPEKV